MGLNARKLVVGSIALGVLLGVFALYLRFDRTPPIVVKEADAAPPPVVEPREPNARESVGTISGVKIGPVRQTEFLHRDKIGRIDRKFGFEELLHDRGSQWEITKPYMSMYLDRFSCRVTADRGKVQLVESFGRPMPSDAEFIGNVVIHVVPTDPSDPWECYIHLDDVGFVSEKSMFSSTGAVRFLSRAVRLAGTGMELLYDGPQSRLEMFRVFDLDSLRMRSSELKVVADKQPEKAAQAEQAGAAAQADGGQAVSVADATETTAIPADPNVLPLDRYRCVFRRNVRLDSPEGLVVARDVLAISGIQRTRPPEPESESESATEQAADANVAEVVPLPSPNALNTTASSYPAMNSIPEELYDIIVTCDGGADITLVGGSPALEEAIAARVPDNTPAKTAAEPIVAPDRQHVVAQRIDFDLLTKDATMQGPVAMKFFIDPNAIGQKAGGPPMPMEVTAQDAVRYLAASEQIVLEGDSTATLHRVEPNSSDESRLAAPRLTLDLAIDSGAAGKVKVNLLKFVADEGPGGLATADPNGAPLVNVRTRRWTGDKLMGWGALDAHRLEYDAQVGEFAVNGPGVIWLHNAETIRFKDDPNQTAEPCYVRLSNFDTLNYWLASHRIVATDDSQQLLLDYFPLVDGKYGPQTQVIAGHVEATLEEIAKNRMGLVSFVASQGIEYDSEADHYNFVGAEMVYDRDKSFIIVQGDDLRPCYLNGALVDKIVVDPKTRKVEAEVPTTSVFEVRQ